MILLKRRGVVCGIMDDRLVNISESNKTLWYKDANNLYGYAMMQKLPYKDLEYYSTSLDEWETTLQRILNTPDDSDHGYCIVCAINCTNSCKDRREQLALMPNKRKINDNELGYIEREREREREVGREQGN